MKKVLVNLKNYTLAAVIMGTLFSGTAFAAPYHTVSRTTQVKIIHTKKGRIIKKTTHTKVVKNNRSKQVTIYKTVRTQTKPKPVLKNRIFMKRYQVGAFTVIG